MDWIAASLFLLLLLLFWVANIFNVPGNWINVLLLGIWKWLHPAMPAGWLFFLGLLALAALAEVFEFGGQIWGAKKYGGSGKGSWGAFLGAIIGALLGTPILLGLGALIGAILGAFLGSLMFELLGGRSMKEALFASKGAMWGKVLGIAAKAGLGMAILVLSAPKVLP
jgi:hypothetical protein